MNQKDKHLETFRKIGEGEAVLSDDVRDAEIWAMKRRIKTLEDAVEILFERTQHLDKR